MSPAPALSVVGTGRTVTRRERHERRLYNMEADRSELDTLARLLTRYFLPEFGQYFDEDVDRGNNQYTDLLDSTATQNVEDATAGISSLVASPGVDWMRLRSPNPDDNDSREVRLWLDAVTDLMFDVFAQSNTYETLPNLFREQLVFGTCCNVVMFDFDDVIRHYPVTFGRYCIAQNYREQVDTVYRRVHLTVEQVVRQFGRNNKRLSNSVKAMFDAGDWDERVTLLHVIEPRLDRSSDPSRIDARNMKWASLWYEIDQGFQEPLREDTEDGSRGLLREKGFNIFPAMVGRWKRRPGDVWGRSPAMQVLGDVMGLQHLHLRLAEAIDIKTKPPVEAPSSLKTSGNKWLAKGINWNDNRDKPITPIYDGRAFEIEPVLNRIEDGRRLIQRALFGDLFRMLSNLAALGTDKTIPEIRELQSEKAMLLGPVGEHLYGEVLEPMVDITLHYMGMAGLLQPPYVPQMPDSLRRMGRLRVEFVSPLQQAQKRGQLGDLRAWLAEQMDIAAVRPTQLDIPDWDRIARDSAHDSGIPERFLRDEKVVQAEREARAMAQAAATQTELLEQQSKAAKNLAQSPTDQPNALTTLTKR